MRVPRTASPWHSGCTPPSSATTSSSTGAAEARKAVPPNPAPIPTPSSASSKSSIPRTLAGTSPERGGARSLAFATFLALVSAGVCAQVAAGRVVRLQGSATLRVPRAMVVRHRVGRTVQGPVDTTLADAAGRFRLAFAADTAAAWLLSARYGGVEYFSQPPAADSARAGPRTVLPAAPPSTTAPV